MKQKVSNYIADFLVANGIKDVFTITGGGAMHLNDAFGHHKGLHCTYNHHEQACAIAAEAYARINNDIALVCVTSGPGGTNAITGVLGGWLDSIPMLIISGQVKYETTARSTGNVNLRQLGDQEWDITKTVKTMTKYAEMVIDPKFIKYHLEKALYLAKTGRMGPVWLDIPLDVQGATIETDELYSFNKSELKNQLPAGVTDKQISDIIAKLEQAKRPVIIVGSGIRLGNAHEKFLELIEKLNIPVVTAFNAHDVLPDDSKFYCGRPSTIGNRGGNFVVQNSDLLISLGCRLNIRQISYNWENFAKNAYKIIVDIDKNELEKPTLKIDMPINASVYDVIVKLLETGFRSERHLGWLNWAKNLNIKYPTVLKKYYENDKPLNPYVFIEKLFLQLNDDETIVVGNGSACVITFQAAIINAKQRLFTNSGCASMGYGFPAALGVAVALKGKRVICLDGDGSFQMNIQELQTLIYNKLNVKVLYINNNGYHSIRQTQTNVFMSNFCGICEDNGVSFPNLEKIAYAYGLKYFKVDSISNCDTVIKEYLDYDGLGICEVVVDESQFFEPKLSSRVLPDGKIVSPSLEDMYPFLDKEEFEQNKIKE